MKLFGSKLVGAARYAEGQEIEVDGFRVRLRVSRRARTVSLRIDPARGVAIATAPSERRLADAANFALSRRLWIAPTAWRAFRRAGPWVRRTP